MRVFVFDPLWPSLLIDAHKRTLEQAGADVVLTTEVAPLAACKTMFEERGPAVLAVNPDYVGWALPAKDFEDIADLNAIITQSTSYGWIDGEAAARKGAAVVNIRNFSTDAVADWAVMMMLNVARKVPLLIKGGFPLNFASDFETYRGVNLKGKKAGIVGLGNIGKAIAERCRGLGMEVCYWSISPKQCDFERCELDKLFAECDVIFPAMVDSAATHGVITDELLQSMKQEGMFISIVHKYYNHDWLLSAVKEGRIYGYGYEGEPGAFAAVEGNIWAAPAYAWCTQESVQKSMDLFVEAIAEAAQGRFGNRVN